MACNSRRADTNSHISRDVASWTLNRNFRNSVDSQIDDKSLHGLSRRNTKMRYDLIASDDEILQASGSGIKRTKSFWKFGGRNEDILAGMSLWQHRDLVAAPNIEELRTGSPQHKENGHVEHEGEVEGEREREREREQEHGRENTRSTNDKNGTLTKSHSNNSTSSTEKYRNDSVTSMEAYDDDENIYGISPVVKRENIIVQNRNSMQSNATTMRAEYTPKSRMKIMKTIEIDIENPTESERLSTIKRGQKEYQKEYRESAGMMPQVNMNTMRANTHTRSEHEGKSKAGMSGGMQSSRNTMSNSHKKHQTNNVDSNAGKHANLQQMKSNGSGCQTQSRAKQQDFPHSTEDEEGDSDDNGTLKMSDVNNFFDDISHENSAGGMIMKTVKRKDILKQYYTSEDESDDVEIKSTSSDPYDCIVINDHLVRKDEKNRRQLHNSYQEHQMEFQTFRATTTAAMPQGNKKNKLNGGEQRNGGGAVSSAGKSKKHQELQGNERDRERERERYSMNNSSTLTRNANVNANSAMNTPTATILPRTRLMKSSNMTSMTLERASKNKTRENGHISGVGGGGGSDKEKNHYGKTYGPWYDFWDQQDQHTLVSQKSMHNGKM